MEIFTLKSDKIDEDWLNYISIDITKNKDYFTSRMHLCVTTEDFEYKNKKFKLLLQNYFILNSMEWKKINSHYKTENTRAYYGEQDEFHIPVYSYTDNEEMGFDKMGAIYDCEIKLKYVKDNLFLAYLNGKINLQDSFIYTNYSTIELKEYEVSIIFEDYVVFEGLYLYLDEDISIEKIKEIASNFIDLSYFCEPIKKEFNPKDFLITFEPKI
ncbi:MAG: hypothetical protein U0457_12605 [Candidatus Sericytochromatia bacterium]